MRRWAMLSASRYRASLHFALGLRAPSNTYSNLTQHSANVLFAENGDVLEGTVVEDVKTGQELTQLYCEQQSDFLYRYGFVPVEEDDDDEDNNDVVSFDINEFTNNTDLIAIL